MDKARRPKLGKLERGENRRFRAFVVEKLLVDWSPRQVAGSTRVEFEDPGMHITKGTQVATLVDRRTRFVMLVKVESPDALTTANALIEAIRNLPDALKDSLTWDRGSEMAGHERITFESKMDIYFCAPRSPW